MAAHEEGFHLEHGDEPAATELLYGGADVETLGRREVLLTDDGRVQPVEGDAA